MVLWLVLIKHTTHFTMEMDTEKTSTAIGTTKVEHTTANNSYWLLERANSMKKKTKAQDFKIGDRVYYSRFGLGKIIYIDENCLIEFDEEHRFLHNGNNADRITGKKHSCYWLAHEDIEFVYRKLGSEK